VTELFVNNEFEKMLKEAITASIEALSRHFLEGLEKTTRKSQLG
jgi:hypothetical protein